MSEIHDKCPKCGSELEWWQPNFLVQQWCTNSECRWRSEHRPTDLIAALQSQLAAAERRAEALVQATEQLIQASRSFRLAWRDQKCGIGIHHGHLEAAEQVAKRAIRGEVELPAQDRGDD